MNNTDNNQPESVSPQKIQNGDQSSDENGGQSSDNSDSPSDFVIGLVTFVVFLVFMTLWMSFGQSE